MITSPEGRRDDPPGFGGSIALSTRRVASNSSLLAAGPPRQDTSASSPGSGHRRGRSSDLRFNPRSYRLGARKVRKGAVLPCRPSSGLLPCRLSTLSLLPHARTGRVMSGAARALHQGG